MTITAPAPEGGGAAIARAPATTAADLAESRRLALGQLGSGLRPALALMAALTGLPLEGARAEVMLLASGLQESALRWRVQRGRGGRTLPRLARGLCQFEPGCVRRVLAHRSTASWLPSVVRALGHAPTAGAVHAALAEDDRLAWAMGRALLWTRPEPLPACDDAAAGWGQYLVLWAPGKPRPGDWPDNHLIAAAVAAEADLSEVPEP